MEIHIRKTYYLLNRTTTVYSGYVRAMKSTLKIVRSCKQCLRETPININIILIDI